MNIQKAKALNIDKLVKRLPEWVAFFRYINRYISRLYEDNRKQYHRKEEPGGL